jgi:hypothetical protein
MRIAYLGNHRPSHSTETHLRLTLESMGHKVLPLQEDAADAGEIVQTANSCDLFLWTRTRGFLKCDGHDMLRRISVTKASYHLDLYAGISREAEVSGDPFWRSDVCFSPDGGSDQFFRDHAIKHHYLPAGVYDKECYLADAKPELDVVFVGSTVYHPEWPYRQRLLGFLAKTYGDSYHKYGNPEPTVRGDDLNLVYAKAKVVVGDTLCPGFNHPRYWSDRVYETMGRGGFIIHPWIKGMQDEFIDGVHIRYYEYGNFAQLRGLIDYYLAHDAERERIRVAGHERVKSACTYRNRLEHALNVISQLGRESQPAEAGHTQPEASSLGPSALQPVAAPVDSPVAPPGAPSGSLPVALKPVTQLPEPAVDDDIPPQLVRTYQ